MITGSLGINIVWKAFEAPIRQIVEKAGMQRLIVAGKLLEKSDDHDFDAQNKEYDDMFEKE
jgi:chaperonin GroEL